MDLLHIYMVTPPNLLGYTSKPPPPPPSSTIPQLPPRTETLSERALGAKAQGMLELISVSAAFTLHEHEYMSFWMVEG